MDSKIDNILKEAYELGMIQNDFEIRKTIEFVEKLNVENFLEIGTNQGGTFVCWSNVSKKDGLKISVDWALGPWGSNFDVDERNKKLSELGDNVYILDGNSHSMEIFNKVKDILGDKKLDFLFIDGDHSEMGVQLDYFMYKEFVRDGGYIGFHDIKPTKFHVSVDCHVSEFWEKLLGEKIWFVTDNDWGGIGLVKK